ncbi:MAG TPA: hypothetical protein EYP85_08975 [Armatimonadetes bacterium]|nr:hypothetical protein [Armatimonadota bacterium]
MSREIPAPAAYQAGCAQEVITPPVGVSLAGYFHDRVARSVRDDLFARALVVANEETQMALVSCDLISVTREVSEAAKEMIEEKTGILPSHVLICATHTHTGPELRPNGVVPVCEEWLESLPRRIAEAVKRAANSLFPATLRAGRVEVEGYSFNRLFRLKDGHEVFGQRGREAEVIGAAGPIDPELQTLSLVDEAGRLRAVAFNFALHVDVIGGGGADFISADWPGEVARNLAAIYGDEVVTLLLQGTCGDINHFPHQPTHLPTGGPAKAVQLGRALAGAVMVAMERAEPMSDSLLAAQLQMLSIPYYIRDDDLRAEVESLRAKPELSPQEKYLVERFTTWPYDGQNAEVPVQVLRLGEAAVVGLPAEIFVGLGLEIKRWSPADFTLVVELANARASTYVPTTDQAERGAYGAKPILSRWLSADAGRRMADAAQVMLYKLWGT